MRAFRTLGFAGLLSLFACGFAVDVARANGSTQLISQNLSGLSANDFSTGPAISADGRHVGFTSWADDLVPNDANGNPDAFVWDAATGQTRMVDVDANGVQGNDAAIMGALSSDGRWAVFSSASSNLVPGDTNGTSDVFVKDLVTNAIERVSLSSAGTQANADASSNAISWDGRFVAFVSAATNLVPNDTNGRPDVFLRDRLLGTTILVSVDSNGVQGSDASGTIPSVDAFGLGISADGARVAFLSRAPNLVANDTNGQVDVFVRDVVAGTTVRVDVDSGGAQSAGIFVPAFVGNTVVISADGNHVAFVSQSSDLVSGDTNGVTDVFEHDLSTGITQRVSVGPAGEQANDESFTPALSADGRYATFITRALNFGPPTQFTTWFTLWVRDTALRQSFVATFDPAGHEVHSQAGEASISADGRFVAFSDYVGLTSNDHNLNWDLFLSDVALLPVATVCAPGDGISVPCPCGNNGAAGHGCANSAVAAGGLLAASGTASASADSLSLTASGLPATTSALLFQGVFPLGGGTGASFGDGVRCAGGQVRRLGSKTAAGGAVAFGAGTGDPLLSSSGVIPFTGGSRCYQVWYRNSAAFCTSELFNLTNGLEVNWHD
jgi:hypothetical protein